MATSADYGRDLLMPKEYFGQGRCEDVSVGQNGSLQDVHIVRQTYTCRTETLYSHCLTPADKHNLSPSLIPCLVLSLTLLLSQKHTHKTKTDTHTYCIHTHCFLHYLSQSFLLSCQNHYQSSPASHTKT